MYSFKQYHLHRKTKTMVVLWDFKKQKCLRFSTRKRIFNVQQLEIVIFKDNVNDIEFWAQFH